MAFPVKIQMNKREKPAYCTIYTCAYSSATRVTRTLESKVVNEWKFGLKKMVAYRNTLQITLGNLPCFGFNKFIDCINNIVSLKFWK